MRALRLTGRLPRCPVAPTWWVAIGWIAATTLLHGSPTLPDAITGATAVGAGSGGLLLLWGLRQPGPGRHAWARTGLLLVSVFTLGIGWNALQARQALDARIDPGPDGPRWQFSGLIERMPLTHERGARCMMRVMACAPAARSDGCRPGQGLRLGWYGAPPLEPGQLWQIEARMRPPQAPINPGLFDAELRALEEGVDGLGSVRSAQRAPAAAEVQAWRALPWSLKLRLVVETWRTRLREGLRRSLPQGASAAGDGAIEGVILGLTIGDQAALSPLWWDRLNRLGVGHLLSISGAHVTAFAAVIGFVLARLWRSRALAGLGVRLTGRVPAGWVSRPRLIAVTACAAAFAYAGLAGWGIPAQRTCWMLAVGAVALSCARTRRLAVIWLLAACVVVLADPWAVLSPGFWLSFGAVAAIVIATRRQLADPTRRHGWREAMRAQFAVTLLMLPLGALFFSSGSWLAPLSNLLAIPYVTLVLTPLSLLGTALVALPTPLDASARPVLAVAAWLADVGLQAATRLDDWAGSAWVLGRPDDWVLGLALLAVAGLIVPWPVRARGLLALGLLPLLIGRSEGPPADTLAVQVIDVGQGMAVLIEAPDRSGSPGRPFRLLYDAGPIQGPDGADAGNRFILPWLRSRGIDHLDVLVISHGDADHAGGALSVLAGMRVDRVHSSLPLEHPIVAAAGTRHRPCRPPAQDDKEVATVGPGAADQAHEPRADALRLDWLDARPTTQDRRPGRAASRRARNAGSCVLRVSSPAGAVLLPGDIAAREEAALIRRHGAARLRADLLIAPHHGSAGSSSPAFVAAVQARDVVFQVGHRNRYGHPRPDVIGRYRQACARLWRSDAQGALSLTLSAGHVAAVRSARLDPPRYWRVPTARESVGFGVEQVRQVTATEGQGERLGCADPQPPVADGFRAAAKMAGPSVPEAGLEDESPP